MLKIEWDRRERAYRLRCAVLLPNSQETLFAFFSDAFQLQRITPDWLNFQILTPAPIILRQGSLIDYQIRLHGIPIRWRTEISSWEPPFAFTDRQVRGPYLLWEHLHRFESTPSGTLAIDDVCYRVPGGRLLNWLFVENDLRRIFDYRQRRLLEFLPQTQSAASTSERL